MAASHSRSVAVPAAPPAPACRRPATALPLRLARGALVTALAAGGVLGLAPSAPAATATATATAAAVAPGPDFDGDGTADLAISGQNAIVIRLGGGKAPEVLSHTGDGFGWELAAGDFDGNGYDDLAVGLETADEEQGQVWVYYADARGLVKATGVPVEVQKFDQSTLVGSRSAGARFGSALAAGDVTGDGVDDLAIGALFHSRTGAPYSGAVTFVAGVKGGQLGDGAVQLISQDSPGVAGSSETDDRFGWNVAIGNVTGDARGDLVVAASGENGVGMVHVLPGTASGPTGAGSTSVLGSDVPGVTPSLRRDVGYEEDSGSDALFGAALAVGDVTGDGKADVVVGVPWARAGGAAGCGGVAVLRGDGAGIAASRAQFLSQSSTAVVGTCEKLDTMGWTVAVGNVDADPAAEVVTSVSGEAIGTLSDAGTYVVLQSTPTGFTGTGSFSVSQGTANVPGGSEPDDQFGAGLDLQDLNRDGRADVVVGAPGEDAFGGPTGTVALLRSGPDGKPATGSTSVYGKDFTLGSGKVTYLGIAVAATGTAAMSTAGVSATGVGASGAATSAATSGGGPGAAGHTARMGG